MNKADYVRRAPPAPAGTLHRCHWPGCTRQVKPALWGCKPHWYMLPEALRTAIWKTFQPGQEVTKRPSDDYIRVMHEVDEWIRAHEAAKAEKSGNYGGRTLDLFGGES